MTGGRRRVGFYVHHDGAGHLARTMAIASELDLPVTVLSSLDRGMIEAAASTDVEIVQLPLDVGDQSRSRHPEAGGALHWAPLDPDVVAPRTRTLVDWLAGADVAALVCDVSVEAAVLARLCGVAPIVVREQGRRDDVAHTLAHRVAVGILAPFPAQMESSETSPWLWAKSFYAGFISRPRRQLPPAEARNLLGLDHRPVLLVLLGAGPHSFDPSSTAGIHLDLAGWQIVLVGADAEADVIGIGIRNDGWVDDVSLHLAAADVVIGTAGANVVAEVAAVGRPFICVPEIRPFDEQRQRADRLGELGVAVVRESWPTPGQWAPVVGEALVLGGEKLGQLAIGSNPAVAADWICRTACEPSRAA